MSRAKVAFLALLLFAFAGCTRTSQESSQQQQQPAAVQPAPDQPAAQQLAPENTQPAAATKTPAAEPAANQTASAPVTRSSPRSAPSTASVRPRESGAPSSTGTTAIQPTQPPPAPAESKPVQSRAITIPSGTSIAVRLQEALDSGVNQAGETFSAMLDRDIEINGIVVARRGSMVEGKLSNVVRSGRVEGRAAMSLQLTSLTVGNQTYPLQTETLAFQAESTKKDDAKKVGIGAGVGAVIGAIAGGGKGAAIGAAVGAGAGGATVMATRGKEIKFDPEHRFNFVLRDDISVKLQ